MWSRRVQRALAWMAVAAMASAPVAARQPQTVPSDITSLSAGLKLRQEFYKPEALPAIPPVELRFFLRPGPDDRAQLLVTTTVSALRRLSEWYGPFPFSQLTIVDAPWRSPWVGASYPGTVVTHQPWLALERDPSAERRLIAALARQYWLGVQADEPNAGWFEEGLALYAGARAIDAGLEGRQFWSARYFGGFVPFAIRSLPLSPPPSDARPRFRHFAELETPVDAPWRRWSAAGFSEAQRAATALYSLERYLGWPAMQQGLAAYRERFRSGRGTPAGLAAVMSEQRGSDLSWFFDQAFRFSARFDYGIDQFSSEPEGSKYRVAIRMRRFGDAVFASLPVSIRFEDGTGLVERWNGREATFDREYETASPAVLASVDPEATLLLDADRSNNTRNLRRRLHVNGVRETLSWLVWLQDLVLTYSALV